MPIISVRDNKNNRWKRNSRNYKQTKTEKNKGGEEAIVKGWELKILLCI